MDSRARLALTRRCSLLALLAPLAIAAGASAQTGQPQRLGVESVMRDLSARRALFFGPHEWPLCCDDTDKPEYPPDGYYDPCYSSPADGVSLVGEMLPVAASLCPYFIDPQDWDLTGKVTGPAAIDFNARGFPGTVDQSNYMEVFGKLQTLVADMKVVAMEGTVCVTRQGSMDGFTDPDDDCWGGPGLASCELASADAIEKAERDGTLEPCHGFNWHAAAADPGTCGNVYIGVHETHAYTLDGTLHRVSVDGTVAAGTVRIDLTGWEGDGQMWVWSFAQGSAIPPSPAPPAGGGPCWAALSGGTGIGGGALWVSSTYANARVEPTLSCGDYADPNDPFAPNAFAGWEISDALCLFRPVMHAEPEVRPPCPETYSLLDPRTDKDKVEGDGDGPGCDESDCGGGGGAGGSRGDGGDGGGGGAQGSKGGQARAGTGAGGRGGSSKGKIVAYWRGIPIYDWQVAELYGSNPCSEEPVDLAYGHKLAGATDLAVGVTGYTFRLTREYSSRPHASPVPTDFGLVGSNWTVSSCRFLWQDGDDLVLSGQAQENVRYRSQDAPLNTSWKADGATTRVVSAATLTLDSVTHPVWRVVEPGQWQVDFYADGVGVEAHLVGLPLQWRDQHGNNRRYEYTTYGDTSPDQVARLRKIYLNERVIGGVPSVEAEVVFNWIIDEARPAVNGRLGSVSVVRHDPDGDAVTTEAVEYTYKEGTDDDTGTAGDLVQVVKRTLVDAAPAGVAPYVSRVWQYRYHDGSTPGVVATERLGVRGDPHQLKSVFMPEQVEYYAQKVSEDLGGTWTAGEALEEAAARLLAMDDDDVEADWPGGGGPAPVDLAAKIVSYDSSTDRVAVQYLQTACGCGGGSSQGLKKVYTYFSHSSDTLRTTRCDDHRYLGTPTEYEASAYRSTCYDMLRPATGAPFYPRFHALLGTGGEFWVTAFYYDAATRNLVRVASSSAVTAYTAASVGAAASATVSTSAGLVHAMAYNAANRLTEVRVGNGNLGNPVSTPEDVSAFTLLSKLHYRTDTDRTHLLSRVDSFRTSVTTAPSDPSADVESVWFTYGFRGSGAAESVAWVRTFEEAELPAENGPASTGVTDPQSLGVACYDTYRLYDSAGRLAGSAPRTRR